MTLEELKARSKSAFFPFREKAIQIVLNAKSPTAAYEWAKNEGLKDHCARGIRFLAMIKRDYGLEVLNAWIQETEQTQNRNVFRHELATYAEASCRISFLNRYIDHSLNCRVKLAEYDFILQDIVREFLEYIDELEPTLKAQIDKDAYLYIDQARNFVDSICPDKYCVEKTAKFMQDFIQCIWDLSSEGDIGLRLTSTLEPKIRARI